MVPSPPAHPTGRPDDQARPGGGTDPLGRAQEAVEAAHATIAGVPVTDPGSGPTRRAVTVVEAILAARRPRTPGDDPTSAH